MTTAKRQTLFNRRLSLWIMLIVLLTACAPAAAPAGAPAAAGEAAASAEAVPLRFGMIGSMTEFEHVKNELDLFQAENPDIWIEEAIRWETLEQFRAALAAGTAPDVVGGIWHVDVLTFPDILPFFREFAADDINVDDFLAGAQRAVATGSAQFFAAPWRAYLCVPNYELVGSNDDSDYPDQALALVNFLTSSDSQARNFEVLRSWYPTRRNTNEEVAGCPDEDRFVSPVTEDQRSSIGEVIRGDLEVLEGSLRGNGVWEEDQPTTFNYAAATGLVHENGQVQVGAVPVAPVEEQSAIYQEVYEDYLAELELDYRFFFLESSLVEYISVHGGQARVIVGGVAIYDGSPLEMQGLSPGSYAAVWEASHDGETFTEERFILVDESGDERWEGSISDLNGTQVNEPENRERQRMFPVVYLIEGSWLLDWIFDSRGGWIP